MVEKWGNIKDFEGFYEVSNTGRVRTIARQVNVKNGYTRQIKSRIRKPIINDAGYPAVSLSKPGYFRYATIHRLVALAFIPNPMNLATVNHIDEDKTNNNMLNLEWLSSGDNTRHGTGIERQVTSRSTPVIQMDLHGNYIAEYSSMAEASDKTNTQRSKICNCCMGKRNKSNGFTWKYKGEE